MPDLFKLPLRLTPQPDGGYIVTSEALPELITEGDTAEEALENVKDALAAVVELYEDLGKQFPPEIRLDPTRTPISFEGVITRP